MQNKGSIPYRVRDKKRPIIGALVTALAVGAALAYTASYISWALEGEHAFRKQPSQIEEVIRRGDF